MPSGTPTGFAPGSPGAIAQQRERQREYRRKYNTPAWKMRAAAARKEREEDYTDKDIDDAWALEASARRELQHARVREANMRTVEMIRHQHACGMSRRKMISIWGELLVAASVGDG